MQTVTFISAADHSITPSEVDLRRSLYELFFFNRVTSAKLNICNLFPAIVLTMETASSLARGKSTRRAATRIPRAVFRGSHSGLTALKFLRGSLKILQRLKRFLTPKLLPPSIYSRAKLSVIYRRESGGKEGDGGSVLSLSLSLSVFLTFFFFASLISRRRFRVSGETSF